MSEIPINMESEQLVGFKSYWDNEQAIIENNLIVITRDTDEWKQGNGNNRYRDLPVIFKNSDISSIISKSNFIGDYSPDTIDKIAKLKNTNIIDRSVLESLDFDTLYKSINDNSIFTPIYINGPDKAILNSNILLTIEGFSSFNKLHHKNDFTSEWYTSLDKLNILESNTNQINIDLPSSSSYINKTITIYGRLIDKLGNISKTISKDILITSDDLSGYITDSSLIIEAEAPTINSYSWNNNTHVIENSYALSVYIGNTLNFPITSLTCNNHNVIIERDQYTAHKFIVTYPAFTSVTEVIYTLTVVDVYGYKDITTINKTINLT
jgi:hypothetical protein